MAVPKLLIFLATSMMVQQGLALTCFLCDNPQDPKCTTITPTVCAANQDTCWKYTGNFVQNGQTYYDRILRSCGNEAYLHAISRSIDYDRCTDVQNAVDYGARITYSGRFCLCDGDRCNSGVLLKGSLMSAALLILAKAFVY